MLVVVVSQIISQRKWEWYAATQERPLSHMQQFDSGSRGSVGAFNLLPTVILKDQITFMAALILFASFLVGPAVQQASRTVECTIEAPGLNASMPFAHYVPRRQGYGVPSSPGSPYAIPDVDLTAAILSAVTVPDGLENQIRGSCSTGNCTFPRGDPVDIQGGGSADSGVTTHSTVGMCNRCADITSFVSRNETSEFCVQSSLPNNFSISRCAGGSDIVMIRPSLDLSWMGADLTPDLRAIARWSHVNATFLSIAQNDSITAAMCSLYPCVRTYTSSINNSDVQETNLRSSVMHIDMGKMTDDWAMKQVAGAFSYYNLMGRYTAVQSPCHVEGKTYVSSNMSAYTNGTKLALYDFTDYGGSEPHRATFRNVTAPESCIYRQHPSFVSAITNLFVEEIFNGTCSSYKGPNCHKVTEEGYKWQGYAAELGAKTVLEALYSNGNSSFANVTKWFDKFADTMTNRYRSDYGTATFNESRTVDLPLDVNQGIAWQSTTCVSMRSGWLLLPIILTAVSTILALWTIATNWRHRHNRPVWKDNILPLLFYGRDMVDDKLDAHSHRTNERTPQDSLEASKGNAPLLETSEMEKISGSTGINIRWLYGAGGTVADHGGETSKSQSVTKRIWRPRKREQHSSNSLLLEPYRGSRTQRRGFEDQVSLETVESYRGTQGNIDDTLHGSRQMR
jgi:hypothetical protein